MVLNRRVVLIALICALVLIPKQSAAQILPTTESGIVAVGFGQATAPIETAELQFIVGLNLYGPAGLYSMGSTEVIDEESTPEAAASTTETVPGVTAEQLQPIVDVLIERGVAASDIAVTTLFTTDSFSSSDPLPGEIRATVSQPAEGELKALFDAVYDAAATSGLAVNSAGAIYSPADCTPLVEQARTQAIADAKSRAEGLAKALGVTLGDLVQATETPFYDSSNGASCFPIGSDNFYGSYGGTYPSFNSHTVEARVVIQVYLTYAIGASA